MKEIGVFCGTFNPIHWGHLLMAEVARDQANLAKVLFVTSPNPPHRKSDLLDAELRHELVSAACSDNDHFEASPVELERDGPSYTVDTLRQLSRQYGADYRLNLIIGEDNLLYVSQWHKAEEIFELCRLIVAPRIKQPIHAGMPEKQAAPPAHVEIITLDVPYAPISGSVIRNRLRQGRSVLYMVTSPVERILREKRLYVE
jgi:nicotinate-nucleotide adenylyltransferase